jgi:hypothetical protein
MRKRLRLSKDDSKVKRMIGLFQINGDLLLVKNMIERALKEPNTFLDYAGIVITYWKCFILDARGACLNSPKYLNQLTDEQGDYHTHIGDLRNKHVAHSDDTKYDRVNLFLHTDQEGKAVSIAPYQDLWEPIGSYHLQILLEIINKLSLKLEEDINFLSKGIIEDYNKRWIQIQTLMFLLVSILFKKIKKDLMSGFV